MSKNTLRILVALVVCLTIAFWLVPKMHKIPQAASAQVTQAARDSIIASYANSVPGDLLITPSGGVFSVWKNDGEIGTRPLLKPLLGGEQRESWNYSDLYTYLHARHVPARKNGGINEEWLELMLTYASH